MHANELWTAKTPLARVLRVALLPASWLYAFGWQSYLMVYRLGLKRPAHPHRPILCIGNLQAGGSGKSPMVRHLIQVFRAEGIPIVVGCSGYGSPRSAAATVAPDGPLDPSEWGDEPTMLRWLEPDIPLIVGRRRVLAAELAHEHFPDRLLLMDDGFQHLPVAKTASIVLDPVDPPNRWCLPAGPYREPRRNRRRADLVLPGGSFTIETAPMKLLTPDGDAPSVTRYAVLCALGNPQLFLNSVTATVGQPPESIRLLGDHDQMAGGTLIRDLPNDIPTVVTAKDWVKLRQRADVTERQFLIASHSVSVEPADEFRAWLRKHLDA